MLTGRQQECQYHCALAGTAAQRGATSSGAAEMRTTLSLDVDSPVIYP